MINSSTKLRSGATSAKRPRIRSAGVAYYADHDRSGPGEINHYYGGRGVYFDTPDGNLFELITQPYGAVPESGGGRDAAEVG